MHGIFEGSGDLLMAFLADSASIFLGGIFDNSFMGFFLIIDIVPVMTGNTAYFTMFRFDKILGNAKIITAPHLRGRNTSTGNCGAAAGRGCPITVHFLQVGMAVDTGGA